MMTGADTLKLETVADTKSLMVIGGQALGKLPAADKIDWLALSRAATDPTDFTNPKACGMKASRRTR